MGIEHPYLAIVSFMLFASMVISITFSYVWVLQQVQRLPALEGYASVEWTGRAMAIRVVVRLTRGAPVTFSHAVLETDSGPVRVSVQNPSARVGESTVTLSLARFRGVLAPGQEGFVILEVDSPGSLFSEEREYSVVLFFDTTIFTARFSVELGEA